MDRFRLKAFISELESSHPDTLERDLLPILKVLDTSDDVSTEQMIEASGAGRLEISGSQLHGEDFSLDKLGGLDFRNCSLSRSNFTKSDLSGVTMDLCGGKAISLRHVTGEAFKMNECNFDSLNASNSSFQGIEIIRTSLKNCFFSVCELARFSISNSECSDVDFSKAILSDGIFNGGLLAGCTFKKSMLSEVAFDGVKFTDIDFSDAQVSGCNFEGTDLRSCNFQDSNLSGSMFFRAEIVRSNFDGAVLEGARFGENTGLDSAGIREFQTRGAIFPAKPRELELA